MQADELKALGLPEIQPAEARLFLALVLSLALHLGLLLLVQVRPAPRPLSPHILQVTLAERPAAVRQAVETALAPPARPSPAAAADGPEQPPVAPAPQAPLPVPAAASPLPTLDVPLADDPVYYTAKQLDVHPAAALPVIPDYPDGAAGGDVEGFVTLKLLLDESGAVREVSLVDAQPPGVFEDSAVAAFRAARFLPGQRNGRPVKSQILIRVTYELVNRPKKKD